MYCVGGDRTVVVGARGPGQLDGGVGNVSHLQSIGGAGGSCGRQADRQGGVSCYTFIDSVSAFTFNVLVDAFAFFPCSLFIKIIFNYRDTSSFLFSFYSLF